MSEPGPGTSREGRVVVVGSVNLDHVVTAAVFPAPGETVHGHDVRSSIGGKGANQAVAAALAGATSVLIGQVGTDQAGADALDALRGQGVDATLVRRRDDLATGTAWITVAAGDNTIVVVGGANAGWPPDWPAGDDAAAEALAGADVVLCQLEIPEPVVRSAGAATRGRFVLNAAPAVQLPDALLARCDVLVVNEHELAVVAGSGDNSGDNSGDGSAAGDLAAAHERLRGFGVRAVVTTLGARGAVLTDDDGTHEIASPPAEVVDTTGAGDAFTGVLCARLAAGETLPNAVRWAVTAGSIAVRAAGTLASYPDAAALAAAVDGAA